MNPMLSPRIGKVVINIGVGKSGKELENAEKILKILTNHKPVRTIARKTVFGARKGEPIGCKVTLRKKDAEDFLRRALDVIGRKLPESVFDENGNFSFGIDDHTDFGIKYDPEIGIIGMDVCVSIERCGYRIARRRICRGRIPRRHRVGKEDAMKFMQEKFGIQIVSELEG